MIARITIQTLFNKKSIENFLNKSLRCKGHFSRPLGKNKTKSMLSQTSDLSQDVLWEGAVVSSECPDQCYYFYFNSVMSQIGYW